MPREKLESQVPGLVASKIQAEISWSGYAISDVISDFILLFFPIPLVWKLQLTMSKKTSVLLVFLLGSLSTAVGITRMVVILYFTYGISIFISSVQIISDDACRHV